MVQAHEHADDSLAISAPFGAVSSLPTDSASTKGLTMTQPLSPRQQRERDFFNSQVSEDLYADWHEFPFRDWRADRAITTQAVDYLGDLAGKRLLLCGVGPELVLFAQQGVEIWGFDISEGQISAAQVLAERFGLTEDVHLSAMPFESLDYPTDHFDVAFGNAILHHIDLDEGAMELDRVLRPGGRASFVEPLGHNPLLNFAREHLPYRSKARTEDERPLHYHEVRTFGRHFARVEYREYTLVSMLRRRVITNRRLSQRLERADRVLLERFPRLRPLSSQIWVGVETAGRLAGSE